MNTNRILLLSIISALVLLVYLLWSNPAAPLRTEINTSLPTNETARDGDMPAHSSQGIATEELREEHSLSAQHMNAFAGAANSPAVSHVVATNSSWGKKSEIVSASHRSETDSAAPQSDSQAGTEFASQDSASKASATVAMSAAIGPNLGTDSTAQQVQMPLALVPSAPEWQPTEQQKKALKQLRDNFASAVGGPNQNPQDPAYFNRWQQALPNADQQYRQWFGDQAFMAQQYNAWVQQHPQE